MTHGHPCYLDKLDFQINNWHVHRFEGIVQEKNKETSNYGPKGELREWIIVSPYRIDNIMSLDKSFVEFHLLIVIVFPEQTFCCLKFSSMEYKVTAICVCD